MVPADPKTQSYHKLVVYQKALDLLLLTYKLTKNLPKDEIYILLPQIRRAAISIVTNIVEGYSKSSTREFIRFLDIEVKKLIYSFQKALRLTLSRSLALSH